MLIGISHQKSSQSFQQDEIKAIHSALLELRSDRPVAIPTETVYGLAAPIDSQKALEAIFHLKKRPFFDPLIVHVSESAPPHKSYKDVVSVWVRQWPEQAQALAEAFWPGPLTLVLPKSEAVLPIITAGLQTVGLRCPRQPLTLKLIEELGVPLAAPSANLFGQLSPTRPEHVRSYFPDLMVLDGGPCSVGIESTILSLTNEEGDPLQLQILRHGIVTGRQIEEVLQRNKLPFQWRASIGTEEIVAPGQSPHHYMPKVPLVLVLGVFSDQEILDEFVQRRNEIPKQIYGVSIQESPTTTTLAHIAHLVLSEDPVIAFRELYNQLYIISQTKPSLIVCRIPLWMMESDDGKAILDRLNRAASIRLVK